MLDNVMVFCQSSIKLSFDKIIYFDPFKIDQEYKDADIIFVTHDHYDHFDLESINKIIKEDTIIVVPSSMVNKVSSLFEHNEILGCDPDKEYTVYEYSIKTVRAYNNNKQFHPKDNNWLGYVIYANNYSYYIMGDTDDTSDARSVKCDVLFIPIGGTYTMDYIEGANYTNYIKPKVVVPIHYKTVVGSSEDANKFVSLLDNGIESKIYIK